MDNSTAIGCLNKSIEECIAYSHNVLCYDIFWLIRPDLFVNSCKKNSLRDSHIGSTFQAFSTLKKRATTANPETEHQSSKVSVVALKRGKLSAGLDEATRRSQETRHFRVCAAIFDYTVRAALAHSNTSVAPGWSTQNQTRLRDSIVAPGTAQDMEVTSANLLRTECPEGSEAQRLCHPASQFNLPEQ
jgi:hypothetical protein